MVLAALALAAPLVAACTTEPHQPDDGPAADLAQYYEQDLEFGPCADLGQSPAEAEFLQADAFECTYLDVPMDYDDPDGRQMQVAVLRVPAQGDPGQRIGSLVTNPGGPGGSGAFIAAVASIGLAESPLLQRFDLVGFDPRGVGASVPSIQCFTDAERDAGLAKTTLLGTSGAWTSDDTQDFVDRCAEGSGGEDVLSSVGTRDAARDMDVLRAALGDDRLSFLGQSYGTRLGAVYAEQFPGNVRAMVLDGAIDPRQGAGERRIELHAGFQRSFEELAQYCAQSADCPLGTDPGQATQVFQELVQPLVDEPVPAGGGRSADFYHVTGGVGSGLYAEELWDEVIAGIAQLADEGRADRLMVLNDNLNGRAPDGSWSNFLDANYAINCMDDERRTPEAEAELRARIAEVNPFLDSGEEFDGTTRNACEQWPAEPTLDAPYAQDVEGLADTLVISTTGDPATPYQSGVNLAEDLGSSLLTVEGERHTAALEAISPCVNGVVADYLIDLSLPADGARCER